MKKEEALELERVLKGAGSITKMAEYYGISRATAHNRRRQAEKVLGRKLVPRARHEVKPHLVKAIAASVIGGRLGAWVRALTDAKPGRERWVRELIARAGVKRRCVYVPVEVSDEALREAVRRLIRDTGVTEEDLVRRMGGE